jgi:hypothetical protein
VFSLEKGLCTGEVVGCCVLWLAELINRVRSNLAFESPRISLGGRIFGVGPRHGEVGHF